MLNYSVNRQVCKAQIFQFPINVETFSTTENDISSGLSSTLDIRGAPNMASSLTPPTPRLKRLDAKDCIILLEAIKHPEGLPTKRFAEIAGLSRAAAGNRTRKKLAEESGLLLMQAVPHRNPNMPPTHIYKPALDFTQVETEYIERIATSHQSQRLSTKIETQLLQETLESPQSKSVKDLIEAHIRPASRNVHILLLARIAQLGEASLRQMSDEIGESRQTVHTRLERLRKAVEILKREKKQTDSSMEFVYFLAPGVDREEVLALAPKVKQLEPESLSEKTEMEKTADLRVEPNSSSSTLIERLLEKLPPFDPSWSSEQRDKWFAAYERLLAISEKGTN